MSKFVLLLNGSDGVAPQILKLCDKHNLVRWDELGQWLKSNYTNSELVFSNNLYAIKFSSEAAYTQFMLTWW